MLSSLLAKLGKSIARRAHTCTHMHECTHACIDKPRNTQTHTHRHSRRRHAHIQACMRTRAYGVCFLITCEGPISRPEFGHQSGRQGVATDSRWPHFGGRFGGQITVLKQGPRKSGKEHTMKYLGHDAKAKMCGALDKSTRCQVQCTRSAVIFQAKPKKTVSCLCRGALPCDTGHAK